VASDADLPEPAPQPPASAGDAAPATAAQWLALEAGGGRYLVPLAQAGEVFPEVAPQRVPYTRPWFLGVINLRGTVCGVVDMAHFLAVDALGVRSEAPALDAHLVTFNAAIGLHCALRVDRLAGLRGRDDFVHEGPALEGAPPYFGRIHTDAAGLHWQKIQLRTLAQTPSFVAIDA
jgi:twitching motility protein PilI